jgi:hypothetical protein
MAGGQGAYRNRTFFRKESGVSQLINNMLTLWHPLGWFIGANLLYAENFFQNRAPESLEEKGLFRH